MRKAQALDPETPNNLYDNLSLARLRSAYGAGAQDLSKTELLFSLRERANRDAEEPDGLVTLFYRLWQQNSAGVPLVRRDSVVVNEKTINYQFIEQHEWKMPVFDDSPHLLIRDEYVSILDIIKEAQGRVRRHVVVTGQPGIGKTAFLYYILLTRIYNGEPTALQDELDLYCLFDFKGARRVPSNVKTLGGVWSLVDSNSLTRIPCAGFIRGHGGPIVEAASPQSDRYKGWAKEHHASFVTMDLWTQNEMQALRQVFSYRAISGFDAEDLTRLYRKWGPSPRFLHLLLSCSPEDCNLGDRDREQTIQDAITSFMKDIHSMALMLADLTRTKPSPFEEDPHMIFFIRPTSQSHRLSITPSASVIVPTPYLRQVIVTALGVRDHANQADFFQLFGAFPATRSVAGMIFETAMHACFSPSADNTIVCSSVDKHLRFHPSRVLWIHSPYTLAELAQSDLPVYLRPSASNNPTFDAAIIRRVQETDNIDVILFQATVGKDHLVSCLGLDKLKAALPLDFRPGPRCQWSFVWVVPDDCLAAHYLAKNPTVIMPKSWINVLEVYTHTLHLPSDSTFIDRLGQTDYWQDIVEGVMEEDVAGSVAESVPGHVEVAELPKKHARSPSPGAGPLAPPKRTKSS